MIKQAIEYSWRVYDDDLKNEGVLMLDSLDSLQWGWRFDDETKRLFVAFRGSDNLDNWLSNLDIVPSYHYVGFGHRGFANASNSIYALLRPQMRHAIERGYSLVFCGHSLGGAIAQMTSERLNKATRGQFLERIFVVTIGSPKCWTRFSRPKVQHTRLVIDDDPVPMLMGLMYHHKETTLIERETAGFVSVSDHKCKHYSEVFNDL